MADKAESYCSIVLKRIFESGFPSEKVYLVADKINQKFPIHTVVLAAVSKYFSASLGSGFQESKKEEFLLEGCDGDTVKAIVDYCYTGQIKLTEENVGIILTVASSVEFDLLENECRQFYEEKLDLRNCADALIVADRYSFEHLRQRALDLICGGLDNYPTEEVQKLDYHLFQEVLKCDKIQATEELIFERLMEWFHYNEAERKPHMPKLLKLIRLKLITTQLLDDIVEAVFREFNCFQLVIDEYKRRALNQCSNASTRRYDSIICLFLQFKGEDGADHSAIKPEKFNTAFNICEEGAEISLGERKYFSAVLHNDQIFVLGGQVNHEHLKSVSAFDLNTGEEETMPEMNFARNFASAISYGKYIYVFGGYDGDDMTSCERFDTETKTWEILNEMTVARHWHSVTKLDSYLCVAGGYPNGDTVELYDPKKDKWTLLSPMNRSRGCPAFVKFNESLYVIGEDDMVERMDFWENDWIEVDSFEESDIITHGIIVGREFIVIKKNGEFGRITIDTNGVCSFDLLGKSKNETDQPRRHFLYQN